MEKLPPGYRCEWNTWKTLNRLRVGVARTKKIYVSGVTIQKPQIAIVEVNKRNNIYSHVPWIWCHAHLKIWRKQLTRLYK
jgi:hypothetical protein